MLIKGCIDPGHALLTPGKGAGDYKEYLSNRNIAKKLKHLLELSGFQIIYSCDIDSPNDKSLYDRAMTARREDCHFLVSIHSNAAAESARGTETFLHERSAQSKEFAEIIHEHLISALGTKDRGVKRADFGILRNTYKFMLSCLTEGEFYTNPEAREWMLTEDYENKYAEGVARGICAYYNTPFVSESKVKGAVKVDNNKPSEWAEKIWSEAKELGFLDGTRPHDNVTREELAAALVRLNAKLQK